MTGPEAASTRYVLDEPVPVERSALSWVGSLLEGLFLGTGTTTLALDLKVIDLRSKDVAYQVRVRNDLELQSAKDSIRSDLSRLNVEEFRREYGIGDYAPLGTSGAPARSSMTQRLRWIMRLLLLPPWRPRPGRQRHSSRTNPDT